MADAVPDSQTRQLLDRWNAGDVEALHALIERYLPWMRARVRNRLGPTLSRKGRTTDYVHDAVIELLRYGARVTVCHEAKFRALLTKIIENTLRSRYDWYAAQRRASDREQRLSTDDSPAFGTPPDRHTTPRSAAERHEARLLVELAVLLLDPEEQEVIGLRQMDGLSFAEIGRRIGISENAARMRFNRALPILVEHVTRLRSGNYDGLSAGGDG